MFVDDESEISLLRALILDIVAEGDVILKRLETWCLNGFICSKVTKSPACLAGQYKNMTCGGRIPSSMKYAMIVEPLNQLR
jgi:hypothetical protein